MVNLNQIGFLSEFDFLLIRGYPLGEKLFDKTFKNWGTSGVYTILYLNYFFLFIRNHSSLWLVFVYAKIKFDNPIGLAHKNQFNCGRNLPQYGHIE